MIIIGAKGKLMKSPDPHSSILTAAHKLIERHGKKATSIAQERANALGANGSSPEHDTALLVLSAVENLSVKIADGETT